MAEEVLVVQRAEECVDVLLLGGVSLDKVESKGLHQALGTILAIVLQQPQEGLFVLGPALSSIAFALENAAK